MGKHIASYKAFYSNVITQWGRVALRYIFNLDEGIFLKEQFTLFLERLQDN